MSGEYCGEVNDNDGNPIAGVSAWAFGTDGNLNAGAATNDQGVFRFNNLNLGSYIIRFQHPDYAIPDFPLDFNDPIPRSVRGSALDSVLYLDGGLFFTSGNIVNRLNSGALTNDQVTNSYVILQQAQSHIARSVFQENMQALEQITGEPPQAVVGIRMDVFVTGQGPSSPTLYENTTINDGGPYWNYLEPVVTGGIPIPTPSPGIASSGLRSDATLPNSFVPDPNNPSSRKAQFVESVLDAAGYTGLNTNTKPWGYGEPYEVRIDPVARTYWYNNQTVDIRRPEWQDRITTYQVETAIWLRAAGVIFNFEKGQFYGNKSSTVPPDNQDPDLYFWILNGWDAATNTPNILAPGRTFVTWDPVEPTVYEYINAYESMCYQLFDKTPSDMVRIVDLRYAGVDAYRYVRQYTDVSMVAEGITRAEAIAEFYNRLEAIGNAADRVIVEFGGDTNNTDPADIALYAPPPGWGSNFNVLNRVEI